MDDSVEEKQEQRDKALWVWAYIYLFCILFGSVLLLLLVLLVTLQRSESNLGHGLLLTNETNTRILNVTYVALDTSINNDSFTFNNFSLLARQFEDSIGSIPIGTIDVITSEEQNVGASNDHLRQRLNICDIGTAISDIEYIFIIRVRYPTQYKCQTNLCTERFFSSVYGKLKTMQTVSLTSDSGVIAQMTLCSIGKTSSFNDSSLAIPNETSTTSLNNTTEQYNTLVINSTNETTYTASTATGGETLIQTNATIITQTALNNRPTNTTSTAPTSSETLAQNNSTTVKQTIIDENPTDTTSINTEASFTTNTTDIVTTIIASTNTIPVTQKSKDDNLNETISIITRTSLATNSTNIATTSAGTTTGTETSVQPSPTTVPQTALNNSPANTTSIAAETSSTISSTNIFTIGTGETSTTTLVQTSATTTTQTALNNNPTNTTSTVIGSSPTINNIDIATTNTTETSTVTPIQTNATTATQTELNNSLTNTTSILIGTSSTISQTVPTKLISTQSSTTSSTSTSTQTRSTTSLTTTLTSLSTTTSRPTQYLYALPDTAKAIWNTVAGGNSLYATALALGIGTYISDESADNLFDNLNNTEYTSRGNSFFGSNAIAGLNTGFFVTVGPCPSVLEGFIIQTGNENSSNDPLKITIEGSNRSINLNIGTSWTLIYNGSTGLNNNPGRQMDGSYQAVNNTRVYTNYRFLVTSKRGSQSDFVSYGEVKLHGHYIYSTISISGSPSLLNILSSTAQPIWNTTAGKDSLVAVAGNVGYGTYVPGNSPTNLFDNSTQTKYISRGNVYSGTSIYAGLNTGFYVTVAHCQAILTGFSFFADTTTSDRDPTYVTVEGSNGGDPTKGANWRLLYSGPTGLKTTNRTSEGDRQIVNNTIGYLSYRFLVTGRRSASNDYVSYADVRLYGYHA